MVRDSWGKAISNPKPAAVTQLVGLNTLLR